MSDGTAHREGARADQTIERPVGLRILDAVGYPFRRLLGEKWEPGIGYWLLCSIIFFGALYLVGLALAFFYGVGGAFLANPVVPSLLLAAAWTAVWVAWAASLYERALGATSSGENERRGFSSLDLAEYQRDELSKHWARLCNWREALSYALLAIAIVALYGYVSIYPPFGLPVLAPHSVVSLFGFPGHSYVMFAYLEFVGGFFAIAGAFGLFFTFEHLRFVSQVVKSEMTRLTTEKSTPTIRNIYIAERPLRELSYITVLSSTAWFGAVAILTAVFVDEVNVATLLGLAFLVVFGLYVFIRPQWEVHNLIQKTKDAAMSLMVRDLGDHWYDEEKRVPRSEHLAALAVLFGISSIDEWHVNVSLVVGQVVGAMIPIALAYLGGALGVRLS